MKKCQQARRQLLDDFAKSDRVASREIHERFCDTRDTRALLDMYPKISLREGLKRMLESGVIFEKWETTELPYMQEELV